MRKIEQVAIIVGISAMMAMGCKGKDSVIATDMAKETTKDTVAESTTKNNVSGTNENKSTVEEQWTKLWWGESMEVDLHAKGALIGGFAKGGTDVYMAMRYNGESEIENPYCYFFSLYFQKNDDFVAELSFPNNLEEVSNDLWETEMGMIFWKGLLGQQGGPFLDRSTLEIEVQSKEIVELNGKKFLREEVIGKSASMGVPKSSRFVAYYYLHERGQGVCVFGDRSKEQTDATYENVKEVAEAVMSTFRE